MTTHLFAMVKFVNIISYCCACILLASCSGDDLVDSSTIDSETPNLRCDFDCIQLAVPAVLARDELLTYQNSTGDIYKFDGTYRPRAWEASCGEKSVFGGSMSYEAREDHRLIFSLATTPFFHNNDCETPNISARIRFVPTLYDIWLAIPAQFADTGYPKESDDGAIVFVQNGGPYDTYQDFHESLRLNGTTYTSVHSKISESRDIYKGFYFTPTEGLVAFYDRSGELYTLVE